jgi:3-deoxy-D-arabino-heptulosonate 7-phosphate (DAHP) synthase
LFLGPSWLVEMGRPELAVELTAASGDVGAQVLGGEVLHVQEHALTDARRTLGSDRYDVLWGRVEAMSYDDAVRHLLAQLDEAIGST